MYTTEVLFRITVFGSQKVQKAPTVPPRPYASQTLKHSLNTFPSGHRRDKKQQKAEFENGIQPRDATADIAAESVAHFVVERVVGNERTQIIGRTMNEIGRIKLGHLQTLAAITVDAPDLKLPGRVGRIIKQIARHQPTKSTIASKRIVSKNDGRFVISRKQRPEDGAREVGDVVSGQIDEDLSSKLGKTSNFERFRRQIVLS